MASRLHRSTRHSPGTPSIAAHERRALGLGEFHRDLVRQPLLDVEQRIVEHRLARRRIGIELTHRRRDLVEHRRIGLVARARLRRPA